MARYWGQQNEEAFNTVGGGSENLQGVSASDRARWDGKQDQLVYDNKPARGSVNVLNSDAVARAFEEFKDAISTAYKQYLSTQVTSYAEMVTAVTNAKNDVDNAYAAIEKYETNMRVLYEDTLSKLTDAQNILAGATTLLNKTNTEYSALSAKIKQLESVHSSIISDLGVLRNALAEVSNDADGAQVRIEELISKANGVDARVAGLVKTVEDALAEIETEKEDTLAKIRAVRDSIPEDYEKVCEDVKEVRQELIDARRRGTWITSETVSGEMVHATNCAPVPPLNIRLYGKTEQPSTEGNQLITYPYIESSKTINGINFIDNGDGSISIKGTATAYCYFSIADNVALATDTYTISGHVDGITIVVQNKNDNTFLHNTFTLTENATVGIWLDISIGVSLDVTIYPMLNQGNVAKPFEPYTNGPSPNMNYQQPLNSHGDSGSIVGKVLNKNQFNPYYATTRVINGVDFVVNDDKTITVNGTATADVNYPLGYFNIVAGKRYISTGTPKGGSADTYYMQGGWFLRDVGEGAVGGCSENKRAFFEIFIKSGTTVNNLTFKPMVRFADIEDDNYEPYTEQPFTVLTEGGLKGIPLGTTIPDAIKNSPIHMAGVYWDNATSQYYIGDTKDYESGEYVQRILKGVLDGSNCYGFLNGTTWHLSKQDFTDIFGGEIINNGSGSYFNPAFSNYFRVQNSSYDTTNSESEYCNTLYLADDAICIAMNSDMFPTQDAEGFKAFFTEHPTEMYVIAAIPIITDLTQEELDQYNALLMNYPNTTIVNDAGAYMEVEYGKDAEAYINENYTPRSEHEALAQRVKVIEEEIIKL